MDNDESLSRQQAHQALAEAASRRLTTQRDRDVYAAGTMASGVLIGVYIGVLTAGVTGATQVAAVAVYLLLLLAISWWQKHAARSVPLGARRATTWATVGTLLVGLAGISTVNALSSTGGRHTTPSLGLVLALAVVSSLPLLLAGVLVRRRQP